MLAISSSVISSTPFRCAISTTASSLPSAIATLLRVASSIVDNILGVPFCTLNNASRLDKTLLTSLLLWGFVGFDFFAAFFGYDGDFGVVEGLTEFFAFKVAVQEYGEGGAFGVGLVADADVEVGNFFRVEFARNLLRSHQ